MVNDIEDQVSISMILSIISALLIVAQIIVNIINLKKERNVKTVTEQRAQWIQKIRDEFSETIDLFNKSISELIKFEKLTYNQTDKKVYIDANILALREKYTKLKFMLNFENKVDKLLLKKIADLICIIDYSLQYSFCVNFPDYNVKEIFANKDLIVLFMSMYLKAEWERFKKESKKGSTDSKYFDDAYNKLMDKNQGEIEKLEKCCTKINKKEFIDYIKEMNKEQGYADNIYDTLYQYDA